MEVTAFIRLRGEVFNYDIVNHVLLQCAVSLPAIPRKLTHYVFSDFFLHDSCDALFR